MYRWFLVGALLSACGNGLAGDDAALDDAGVIDDAPSPPTIVAASTLGVLEGDQQTLLVRLAADPGHDVTIGIASRDTTTATVAASAVTVSRENYAKGAEIPVLGVEDDDDVSNDVAVLDLSVDGIVGKQVTVTVYDNDVQQIVVDTPSLTIDEGAAATFAVRLARRPAATVTAQIWSDAAAVAAPSPSSLAFSPADYAMPHTVSVSAPVDTNTANSGATIHVEAVDVAMAQTLHVDVIDHDIQALIISATQLAVAEGATTSFTVALAYDPLATVQVQVQSSDPATLAANLSSLSFNSTNYNVPHTVALTGVEDNDHVNETATVGLSGVATGSVDVTVTDNDDIVLGASSQTVLEGRTATFPVRLGNDPGPSGHTVDVDVVVGNLVVRTTSLTFTSADYATYQNVEIYAPVDPSTSTTYATVRLSYPGQVAYMPITIIARTNASKLANLSVRHETFFADGTGWLELKFDIDSVLPGDGRIVLDFAPGFDASTASVIATSLDGTLTLAAASASALTLVRSGGTTLYGTDTVTIRLGGIHNPIVPGSYPLAVATQSASGGALDSGTASDGISAVYMPNATITLADLAPGASGNVTATFTTMTSWPGDGAFEIYFPLDFDVSNVTFVSATGVDGTFTASMSAPYRVRISRTAGTLLAGGSQVSLTVGNITNPATAQATTYFEAMTESSAGTWINEAFPDGVTIGCPATMTKPFNGQRNVPFGGDPWALWGSGAGIYRLESSDLLVLDDFRFVMPAGATVAGIQFDVERQVEWGDWPTVDSAIRGVNGGAIGSFDESSPAQWPWPYATQTYGGPTDQWGQTWTPADIESSTFGVAVAAKAVTPGMTSNPTVRNVTATIYLSCP